LLSGRYQIKYLVMGLFAAGLVTYLTGDLLYKPATRGTFAGNRYVISTALRYLGFIPWLVWTIIKSNIQIALIILNPRMPIDPGLFQFSTQLKHKVSQVTLANSITLTPGTITAVMHQRRVIIHYLVPGSAGDLESGYMQNKVGALFREKQDVPRDVKWASSTEELTRE
jgi:multicomponent Na+:H+ antiporter subunit E